MPQETLSAALRHLARFAGADSQTDHQLLARFAATNDGDVFAELVRRHGPMVLGACRRVLRHEQDAEDAFQATFLTLARKAASPCWGDTVGPWLHEVACRLAAEARRRDSRRLRHERRAGAPARGEAPTDTAPGSDLDEELRRLPEPYRALLVLCYLEGVPREQAAGVMGWSLRTLDRRLSHGRELLRQRLQRLRRRGLPALAPLMAAAVPGPLIEQTARSAGWFTARGTARDLGAGVSGLLGSYSRTATVRRLKLVVVLLLMGATGGAGVAVLGRHAGLVRAAHAAPAPLPYRYQFRPVRAEWVKTLSYLKPDEDDPPNSYTVVAPEDRDRRFAGYHRECRYHAKAGDREPVKILRYFPSGRLQAEIDNRGDEQHNRTFHPGGSEASYVHWRAGKWLDGYSVSPDGKTRHRLREGAGELVAYGRRPGARLHTWYHQGFPFLEKRFREGGLTCVRLNEGEDWLIGSPAQESLLLWSRGEVWRKRREEPATVQRLGGSPWLGGSEPRRGRRPEGAQARPAKLFAQRRAEFLSRYATRVRVAGRDARGLGIEFVWGGGSWPVARTPR